MEYENLKCMKNFPTIKLPLKTEKLNFWVLWRLSNYTSVARNSQNDKFILEPNFGAESNILA